MNSAAVVDTIKQVIGDVVEKVKAPTPTRLRDLIRQIRTARTAAEERAVVNKECAYIRSTFREEDAMWRCRNVAKLLYIHMLGYPAHFGQLECLKLIASPRFTDKRIGYLGAMLLLDERQDIHVLITNSLKNDLNNTTQFTVGLALCTLGAIASPEMGRDLASEVEKLLKSTNAYIRKKAALCAYRIICKVPDLMEVFLPATRSLLTEKNHGVLVTGVTLITEMCRKSPDTLSHFKKMVPNLVRILKNLLMAGYSPEHDVSGISDPFLQVKILRLLRVLGKKDTETSEAMNDILAQVATNTETSKNVGNSILYETVLSIMEIESDSGLRVLGVNILGRFLLNSDKNIRYIALNTLLQTVHIDYTAVMRHRQTIVDCLKDPDVSIRRRALELSFLLINQSNIKVMSRELLLFLDTADPEFQSQCSSNMVLAAEKYAPTPRWHFEMLLKVLLAAGNYVRDDVVAGVIQLVSEAKALQGFCVGQLWKAVRPRTPQEDAALLPRPVTERQPLAQVAMWCLGEFGEHLLSGNTVSDEDDEVVSATEAEIVIFHESVLLSNQSSLVTKEYALMALGKSSSKFTNSLPRIEKIIRLFTMNINVELQQRSLEFSQFLTKKSDLKPVVFEKMPPMETGKGTRVVVSGDAATENGFKKPTAVTKESDSLLDLLGLGDSTTLSMDTIKPVASQSSSQPLMDLLAGFDMETSKTNTNTNVSPLDLLMGEGGLLGTGTLGLTNSSSVLGLGLLGSPESATPLQQTSNIPTITAYEKNGIHLLFSFSRDILSQDLLTITLIATNKSAGQVSDFLFQAAVPKAIQLQMFPPSSTTIPAMGSVDQQIKITNPSKAQLRMRIKLSFKREGVEVSDQGEVNNFPPSVWQ